MAAGATQVSVSQTDGGVRVELTGGRAAGLDASVLQECIRSIASCADSSGCMDGCGPGTCAPTINASCLEAIASPADCWQRLFKA